MRRALRLVRACERHAHYVVPSWCSDFWPSRGSDSRGDAAMAAMNVAAKNPEAAIAGAQVMAE